MGTNTCNHSWIGTILNWTAWGSAKYDHFYINPYPGIKLVSAICRLEEINWKVVCWKVFTPSSTKLKNRPFDTVDRTNAPVKRTNMKNSCAKHKKHAICNLPSSCCCRRRCAGHCSTLADKANNTNGKVSNDMHTCNQHWIHTYPMKLEVADIPWRSRLTLLL